MADSKYLSKHHDTWVLQIKVPTELQAAEGRQVIRKSLKTGDVRAARTLRDIELGKLRDRWERLKLIRNEAPFSTNWLRSTAAYIGNGVNTGELDRGQADLAIDIALEQHLEQHRNGMKKDGTYPAEEFDINDEQAMDIADATAVAYNPSVVSLSAAIEQYLTEIKSRIRLKSWNQKKRYLAMLSDYHGPHRSTASLDRPAARRFMQAVVHKLPVATSTRKTAFRVFNAFGQWCDDSALTDNMFMGMGRTIKEPRRGVKNANARRPWTEPELVKLFSFKDVDRRNWKVWYGCALLLMTGARRGELLNATAGNVVHEGRGIEIKEAKNQESLRVIPLHPLAQPLVAQLLAKSTDGYLFPGYPAGGLEEDDRGNAFLKQFNVVRLKTTGIGTRKGLDLHSFRHTFETHASNQGMDQRIINEITGHANSDGTGQRVYLHGIEFERCYEALAEISFDKAGKIIKKGYPT